MNPSLTISSELTLRQAQHPNDVEFMGRMLNYAAGNEINDPGLTNYRTALSQGKFDGLIAENGSPVGSAWFSYFTDQNRGYADYRGYPEVTIGIEPEYRSRGVGSLLLNGLVDIAQQRRIEALILDVDVTNVPAINLYMRIGFRPCKEQTSSFQTMVLELV